MTFKMKECINPQPESGQGSYTQESGEEQFSADLTHCFTENYDGILTTSEPKQHSSVTLIRNDETEMADLPLKDEKVPHSECFETESQKVSSGEDKVSLDVPQNPTPSPNAPSMQEEEAVKPSTGISTIINIEEGENTSEKEAMVPEKGRNGTQKKKTTNKTTVFAMTKKKKVLLGFGLTAAIVVIVVGPVAHAQQQNPGSENTQPNVCKGNCFTCMDKGKCLNMTAIFRDHDAECPIYQKTKTQAFPKCSEIVTPEHNNCSVCFDRDDIRICCSKDVTDIVAEERSGNEIENIPKGCQF